MNRAIIIFLSLFLLAIPLLSQTNPTADASSASPGQHGESGPWTREQIREMQKKQREIRQKQLQEDTAKLLQLATELKESVDKTNEHVLSLDVIKKAEDIEKLAKHIKTNMRDEAR